MRSLDSRERRRLSRALGIYYLATTRGLGSGMSSSHESNWKTRLVQGGFPDRSFDIEFWQEQGDEAIFAAAWEMVELAEEVRNGRKSRLQRLLQLLNDLEVRYLIVGGYAVMKYAEPRYTKDLDLWVENSAENAARVFEALERFGAPLESDDITQATFTSSDLTYQIGIAPIRIDGLTRITGVEFSRAWQDRVAGTIFGIPVHFISLDHLVKNKQATGQSSDLEQLKYISRQSESNNYLP